MLASVDRESPLIAGDEGLGASLVLGARRPQVRCELTPRRVDSPVAERRKAVASGFNPRNDVRPRDESRWAAAGEASGLGSFDEATCRRSEVVNKSESEQQGLAVHVWMR